MEIRAIKTEEDYKNVIDIIDALIDSAAGSQEADQLEVLSILIEDFENKVA